MLNPFKSIKLRYLLLWNLLILFGVVILGLVFEKWTGISPLPYLAIPIYLLSFLYLIRIFKKHDVSMEKIFNNGRGVKVPWLKLISFGVLLFFLCMLTALGLIYFVALLDPALIAKILSRPSVSDTKMSAANILTMIILAPVVEEFTFRGLIFNKWAQRIGVIKAMIFSSLLFSLLHIGTFYLPQLLAGCFLCLVYIKTKKLYVSMILHGLNNSLVMIFANLDFGTDTSNGSLSEQIKTLKEFGLVGLVLFLLILPFVIRFFVKLYKSSDIQSPYSDDLEEITHIFKNGTL